MHTGTKPDINYDSTARRAMARMHKADCGCVHGIDKHGREVIVKLCPACAELSRARHEASAAERAEARMKL